MIFSLEAITRVTDHRHHGTDVLAGAILGTVIAIIAVRNSSMSGKTDVFLCVV